MAKAWAKWDFKAEGRTLRGVPNYDSLEALQYLYGLWYSSEFDCVRYRYILDAVEYVGQCLDDGHFDSRFYDECAYLELTVDAWDELGELQGDVEFWFEVKQKLRDQMVHDAEVAAARLNF